MKRFLISALALGTLATSVYAGCTTKACSAVKVTRLYLTAGGTLYVGTNGDETNLNCQAPGNSYMSLQSSDVGKNAMYAALLAAKASDNLVTIRIQEGTNDCRILYTTID